MKFNAFLSQAQSPLFCTTNAATFMARPAAAQAARSLSPTLELSANGTPSSRTMGYVRAIHAVMTHAIHRHRDADVQRPTQLHWQRIRLLHAAIGYRSLKVPLMALNNNTKRLPRVLNEAASPHIPITATSSSGVLTPYSSINFLLLCRYGCFSTIEHQSETSFPTIL